MLTRSLLLLHYNIDLELNTTNQHNISTSRTYATTTDRQPIQQLNIKTIHNNHKPPTYATTINNPGLLFGIPPCIFTFAFLSLLSCSSFVFTRLYINPHQNHKGCNSNARWHVSTSNSVQMVDPICLVSLHQVTLHPYIFIPNFNGFHNNHAVSVLWISKLCCTLPGLASLLSQACLPKGLSLCNP